MTNNQSNENLFHFKDNQGEFTLTRDDLHIIYIADGSYGIEPGSFTVALINLAFKADLQNFAKLATQFPGVCESVFSWKNGDLPQRMNRAKNLDKPAQNPLD